MRLCKNHFYVSRRIRFIQTGRVAAGCTRATQSEGCAARGRPGRRDPARCLGSSPAVGRAPGAKCRVRLSLRLPAINAARRCRRLGRGGHVRSGAMRCFRARHTAGLGEGRACSAGCQRLVREQIRGSLCNRNAREKRRLWPGVPSGGQHFEPARSRSSRERGLSAGLTRSILYRSYGPLRDQRGRRLPHKMW